MPYQANIPEPTDQLDDSQGDIKGNFQEIFNWVAVNHEQFGSAAGQGKHTQVTLPENVAPTNTAIDEANIYSQLSTFTNQTELFWQQENNGLRIGMTESLQLPTGWSRLPSGVLLKWGSGTATGFNQQILIIGGGSVERFFSVFTVYLTTRSATASTNQVTYVTNSFDTIPDPQTFNVNCYDLSGNAAQTSFQYFIIGQ